MKSCLTLCDPMDCSLPGFSVHGIFQARVPEWVAFSFSRGSSWPRDRTRSPSLWADALPSEPPGKPKVISNKLTSYFISTVFFIQRWQNFEVLENRYFIWGTVTLKLCNWRPLTFLFFSLNFKIINCLGFNLLGVQKEAIVWLSITLNFSLTNTLTLIHFIGQHLNLLKSFFCHFLYNLTLIWHSHAYQNFQHDILRICLLA